MKKPATQTQEILADVEFNKKWDLEGQYQFLRKSNDPRFGDIGLYKSKNSNDMIFAKEKLVTSKQQASNDIKDLKSRMALNSDNLHKLIGYSTSVQKELCSTNYLTKAFYEYPKTDLQKEINDKKSNGQSFSSSELLNIGNQALNGLNHLHKLEISHGDVRPVNIGYNKDTKNVQILDRLNNPAPMEQVQTKNMIDKKDLFVSPEVYKKIQGTDKTLKYNPYKNDLYGLGLSLLSAGNGEKLQNIYEPNGNFNQGALDNHLQNFDNKYQHESPVLSDFVHRLVSKNEGDRLSAQEYLDMAQRGQLGSVNNSSNTSTVTQTHKVFAEAPIDSSANTTTVTTTTTQTIAPSPVEQKTIIYDNSGSTQTTGPSTDFSSFIKQSPSSNTTTTTNYVNTTPSSTITYVNTAPSDSYTYTQAPTVTYSQPQSVVYTKPSVTYTQAPTVTYSQNPTVTYSQAPTVTYTQAPSVTYTQAPTVTYVKPSLTVSQAQPVTYTEAPTTYTYIETPVTQAQTVTYTQSPVTYTQSPITYTQSPITYTQAPSVTYTSTPISHSPITITQTEAPKIVYSESSNVTYAEPQKIVYSEPQTISYTNYQPTQSNVVYTTSPVTYVSSTDSSYPKTERVERKSNTTFINAPIEQANHFSNTPQVTVYSGPEVRTVTQQQYYVNETPVSSIQQTNTSYNAYQTGDYKQPVSYISGSNDIEVRRGSSIPVQSELKVIKKKYVVEGDKIIEVDAEE